MLFDIPKEYADFLVREKKEGSAYRIVDGVVKGRTQAVWFTNLDHGRRHQPLPLMREAEINKFTKKKSFERYDNYDAIEVPSVKHIPSDHKGMMGVPISFLDKYNPDQFELIGIPTGDSGKELGVMKNYRGRTDISVTRNGKTSCPYSRIIIKRKK